VKDPTLPLDRRLNGPRYGLEVLDKIKISWLSGNRTEIPWSFSSEPNQRARSLMKEVINLYSNKVFSKFCESQPHDYSVVDKERKHCCYLIIIIIIIIIIILSFQVINNNQNTVDLLMNGLTMGVAGTGNADCQALPNYVHI
jgi:hypothetical protein